MKRLVTAVAIGSVMSLPMTALAQDTDLSDDQSKLSYSIGATLAQGLSQDVENLDVDAFTAAVRDTFDEGELQLSEEEITSTLSQFQQQRQAQMEAQRSEQEAQRREMAENQRQESEAFLEENAQQEGVETTDSGLQYKVLESGDGESPEPTDTVRVNYEGTLPDGTVFDSSYERGEPISFQLDQVIPGWQEGLGKMSVGDTWMLYVPSDLAYGTAGTGGPIGPNQALQFKVELLAVNPDEGGAQEDSPEASATGQ